MVIGFLPHIEVDYFYITVETLMCLQDELWINMEGNEIDIFT